MYYFEHIPKLPIEIEIPFILLLILLAVGLIFFAAYYIRKKYKKSNKFLFKQIFSIRKNLKRKGICDDSDFDMIDSANDASEATIRSKILIVYFAMISLCIFALLYFSISFYSQTYSIDYSTAVAKIDVLEKEASSMCDNDMNIQSRNSFEDNDYYIRELKMTADDNDYSVQICYDKIDKMNKICVKSKIDNDNSNSVEVLTKIFNTFAMKNVSVSEINDFYKNHNDYLTDIISSNGSVYQYDYCGEFGSAFIVKNQDNTELLISGIIALHGSNPQNSVFFIVMMLLCTCVLLLSVLILIHEYRRLKNIIKNYTN